MDSFQFWLYVIIAIVYVLSRALKKKDPRPNDNIPDYEERSPFPYESADSTAPKTGRPLTFEELLKEITESKATTSQPAAPTVPTTTNPYASVPAPRKTPGYVDYDDDLKNEEQVLEETNYDYRKKDTLYETYENAKRQAFNQPSLEETMKISDTDMKYGRFKEFERSEKKDSVLTNYLKELNDPEGVKKAFVLSEVLNRKF